MMNAIFAVAALAPSAVQAQPGPCFWAGQVFTCNQPSQGQANADVFIAQTVTGPASSFPRDISAEDARIYNAGVHDAMVKTNLPHLAADALSVSTEVVTFGSRQVYKSRVFAPSQMFMYQYAGVSGPNMVIVGCISRTARPFDTSGTECERQAAKTFGK